jgi:L-asparaginase
MTIRVFATGGTFDKEYNELDGTLYFKDSHIKDLLALGRSKQDIITTTLMMVDSLEMNLSHRQLILDQCRTCPETQIIVTHGTDTMADTAKFLGEAKLQKTIVLTGAMIPVKFGSSDGLFNMGCAIGFVQALNPGVYVAMNGRVFTWDNVQKDRKRGEFQELAPREK